MKEKMIKFLALWFRSWGQKKNKVTLSRVLKVANKIIKSQKYCTLNTISGTSVHSRVLQPLASQEEELVFWFGTSIYSRKVEEIKKNCNGSILFLDSKKGAAVSLTGRFEIIDDLNFRKKYFHIMWWAFFVDGPEGNDFVSLKFVPDQIEVWDAARGIAPEPFGLLSAKVSRKDQNWVLDSQTE